MARTATYLQSILNAFNDLIFVFDENGYLLDYVKETLSPFLVLPKEQFIGKHHKDVLPPHVSGKIEQAITALKGGKESFTFDYDLLINDRITWFSASFSALKENNSQKYLCVISEITEKKLSELDLQAALEQLQLYSKQMDLFFSQSLTGYFWMMMDKPVRWDDTTERQTALDYAFNNMHFTRVNDAMVQQYRTTQEELKRRWFKDFFPDNPDHGKEILQNLFDQKHIHINRVSRRFDGTEWWGEGDYICLTNSNNEILGYFGTQKDVTERKYAEESLRASEERYRLLANNMLDLVALHAPDGTYKYVSPSVTKMLGYAPEELLGTSPYPLFHPDDIKRIQEESHTKAQEGEEIASIEYRIKKKDGNYIWLSTSTKPITDDKGKVLMLQTVSHDVTERVATLHQLEELNHQKNKLFSIIGHDLRGPVANCMSLLQLIQRQPNAEDMQRYLKLLNKSIVSLYDLMEDLLLWASNQLSRTVFEPTQLNLADEINSVNRTFSEMAESKKINVISSVTDSFSVYGDKNMVRTILRNLITNAIKFTEPGGHISIDAKRNNGWIEISVADTGRGIKNEDLQKLFSKTSSFTTYGTSGEKGTGLGLKICSDFVERHQGKIWAESEPGAGSKFTFTLQAS